MLEIGMLLDGKYKILSEIGRGGMSVVYMAINEKANKTWAVKEVRRDGVIDYEAVRQGLIVETDLLKKLRNPHLPSIVDVIEGEESFIIVMDYIEGRSLGKALKEYGAQPQEYVIEWAKQLCDVLGYLHSRTPPIIYRDMKPDNIMLKPDGNIMVIDFGTAREFKAKNLADTSCLGTVGYAAPEQFGGRGQTDARTDIFGLGATMHHLLTGRNPNEPPYTREPIRSINPSLSAGLEKIIEKCTQEEPINRYQSAEELMYDLEHFEEVDDRYKKKQKHKLAAFITAASLSVVLAGTGLGLNIAAGQLASSTYDELIKQAEFTDDVSRKEELYIQCINIPDKSGDITAYQGLIELYKEDDFTKEEEHKLITELIEKNMDALETNRQSFAELCFDVGELYFGSYKYYTDSEDNTSLNAFQGAKASEKWFKNAYDYSDETYENHETANAYRQVGALSNKISNSGDSDNANQKAPEEEEYRELFKNMNDLIEYASTCDDQYLELKIYDCALTAIDNYTYDFIDSDISSDELMDMYDHVESAVAAIKPRSKYESVKAEILERCPGVKERIEYAKNAKEEA